MDTGNATGKPQTSWQEEEALLDHRRIGVGEISLHVVLAGPEDGPLIVLLHGFPELWYSWRHQIPALAAAGFRVVAPDQRGYNLSDKPRGTAAYDLPLLADDVRALIHALGRDRATVVGHDWGGMVAWWFAMRHADKLDRLVILDLPHPQVFARALRKPKQLAMSWYIGLFQLLGVSERIFAARDFAALRRMLRTEPVRAGAFTEDDVARYVEAIRRPGALTAALSWYRAGFGRFARGTLSPDVPIHVPTLVLWGDQDRYLDPANATPPEDLVPNARVVVFDGASHWLQVDAAERVNAELLAFLGPATG